MKYTIITVNFNNKDGLRQTIESVISQTYRDFEYIVIDGGSTDGSVDVLKEYDRQIDYWVSEPDSGIYNGMNKGIAKAHGDYLNFMNSGDRFYDKDVLSRLTARPLEADLIVGRDYHFNEQSGCGFATILPPRISMLTFYNQTLPHQSTFIRREMFDGCPYDETFRIVSDIKFYIQKLCVEGRSISLIDDIICRREPDGVSKTYNDRRITEHQTVIQQFLPQGAIKDYQTLTLLDKSTLYKLMKLLQFPRSNKIITICIKIINRIYGQ